MTYHPDSVLVEKVAKARWKMRGGIVAAWENLPPAWRAVEIEAARRYLRVACPLVAGVIADRLDEMIDATPNVEPAFARGRDAVVNVIRGEFVRSEFVDGEA